MSGEPILLYYEIAGAGKGKVQSAITFARDDGKGRAVVRFTPRKYLTFHTVCHPEQRRRNPVEVEYEITREDLYAFQWRAAFESPRARRVRRLAYLGWVLAILIFALVPAIGPDGLTLSRMSVTFILVPLAVFFVLTWGLERWLMRRAIRHILKDERPDRGVLGRHRVSLDEDGVRESTAVGESRTAWAGIDRVEDGPEYIYLYTSAAAAHLIPRRAFSDPLQADAFYQFARARKAAAG